MRLERHNPFRSVGAQRIQYRKLFLAFVVCALTASAQAATVTHSEDFQSYDKNTNPPGWIDTSVGDPRPEAEGLYKVRVDPTQGNKGSNLVYGTVQASGKPEGRHPRIGTFSTLTSHTFDGEGRFEYKGRILRTRKEARVGLTFFSSYPEADSYYLIGLWSQASSTDLTFQWHPRSEETKLQGKLDSGVRLVPENWYRFYIQVDAKDDATFVRAKFWPDGTDEPETWQIDGFDSSPQRLTGGRIGMWAAVRGEAYVDDLFAKSPIDLTAPVITFRHAGDTLNDGQKFSGDVTPEIVVIDDVDPSPAWSATLDGDTPFVSGTVTEEGVHVIEVQASDSAGNQSTARVSFTIDKTPPVVDLSLQGTSPDGTFFSTSVVPRLEVGDSTETSLAATLDGNLYNFGPIVEGQYHRLGPEIIAEGPHEIVVTATDEVDWATTRRIAFTIDKTRPTLSILANGAALLNVQYFSKDVELRAEAEDDTLRDVVLIVDGTEGASTVVLSEEKTYTISARATDAAGWTTTVGPRTLTIDRTAPDATLQVNDDELPPDGFAFNDSVFFHIATPETGLARSLTLDGAPYVDRTLIEGEGPHVIAGTVIDAAGNELALGPFSFHIDRTRPQVTVSVDGESLMPGALFATVPTISITATDETLADLAILDGDSPMQSQSAEGATTVTLEVPFEEGPRELVVVATDRAGWTADFNPVQFVVDLSPPEVAITHGGEPMLAGWSFNETVEPLVEVVDDTPTETVATLNGSSHTIGTPISDEGSYELIVTVTDALGWSSTVGPLPFRIDLTPPALTVDSHQENAVVARSPIVLAGDADDATAVSVDGEPVERIDPVQRRWTSVPIDLLEGPATFTIVAIDEARNRTELTRTISLDTRGPSLTITTPAAGACLAASSLDIAGIVGDPNIESVNVTLSGPATLTSTAAIQPGGSWTAAFPSIGEGEWRAAVEARDAAGHVTAATTRFSVDRTPPVITISQGGAPFTSTIVSRPVTPVISATDGTGQVSVAATLDGQPWSSGAQIAQEGSHTLVATATDCAGNQSVEQRTFTIDLTAPELLSVTPANAALLGTIPVSISGTTSPDATSIELIPANGGATATTSITSGAFSISGVPFANGVNRFTIQLTDAAGNRGSSSYEVTIRTDAPTIDILEGGRVITSGALFRRAISPEVRSSDPAATISVTLNGSPFTPGSAISDDGSYTLRATATDELGHSGTAEVSFSIDTSGPTIAITSPADGASIDADVVNVTGSAADAVSVTVNGYPATLSGSTWSASIPIELGETVVRATAFDPSGNSSNAAITVHRSIAPAIVISSPANGFITNRRTIVVEGFVLSPQSVQSIVVDDGGVTSRDVAPDARGRFRLTDWALVEGSNIIRASATSASGLTSTATVEIAVDLTAPVLDLLANETPLRDEASFPTSASLTLALDATTGITSTLRVDGVVVETPHLVTAPGWHIANAVATDAAGNQARLERVFRIGTSSGSSACAIDLLDPATGSVINDTVTSLSGRIGTAPGATVNGVPVTVIDGSFCTTVPLEQEGDNPVTIRCTDANGDPLGEPKTVILRRTTGAPSVTLTLPASISYESTITASGTVSSDTAVLEVNGKPVVFTNGTYSTPVTMVKGPNLIRARATNSAGQGSLATALVEYRADSPRLAMTSPVGNVSTGGSTIDLAGTWSNLNPTTIQANGVVATIEPLSDTHGVWRIDDLPLTGGENVITIAGNDGPARTANVALTVNRIPGLPSISIDAPLDQDVLGGGVGQVVVRGTFTAAPGSIVQVNGAVAAISDGIFEATVPAGSIGDTIPIVARVVQPDGQGASSIATVKKRSESPTATVFPKHGSVGVDPSALIFVSFSHEVDPATVAGVTVTSSNGVALNATRKLDREVLWIAPSAPLTNGETYTVTIPATIRDAGGNTIAAGSTSSFTVLSGTPTSTPIVDPIGTICSTVAELSGTASPGAKVRIVSGSISVDLTADSAGRFRYALPLSGRDGYQLARIYVIGGDGSLSSATPVCIRTSCDQFRIVSAIYDRTSNVITVEAGHPVDAGSVDHAITLLRQDGHSVAASSTVSGATISITPSEDLTTAIFTMTISTALSDTSGRTLALPYERTFFAGGDTPESGEGEGVLSGEAMSGSTGRPLPGAEVKPSTPVNAYSKPEDDQ